MRGLVIFLCYQVDSVINNINLNLTKVTITYLSKTLIYIFQSTYICRKLNKCINEIFRSLSEVRIVFNFKIRTAILYSFRIIPLFVLQNLKFKLIIDCVVCVKNHF